MFQDQAFPKIRGFDRQGEPELRAGENGAIELVFNFMPPLTSSGAERQPELFDKFEAVLARHVGVPVARDDREVFVISHPKPETASQIAAYLAAFWNEHAQLLRAALEAVPRSPNAPIRNQKEFKAIVLASLTPLAAAYGYKAMASAQDASFRKKTAYGHQTLWSSGHDIGTGFRTGTAILTRHETVERIYASVANTDPRYFKNQWTIAANLIVEPAGWEAPVLRRPSDFEAWAKTQAETIKVLHEPLLERLGDPGYVESLFNRRLENPRCQAEEPLNYDAYCKALILAKLLGKPDIERIIAHHEVQMAPLEIETAYPATRDMVRSLSTDEILARAKAWSV
jgi:hypothetical protein